MKNLLFWLYAVVAVVLIAFGYMYWEDRVTDNDAREKAINQTTDQASKTDTTETKKKKDQNAEPNKNLFKNKELQNTYNKLTAQGKKMNITLLSTPYQVSDSNSSVKDELEFATDAHIEVKDVEMSNISSKLNTDKIFSEKPDLVVLDALTLNDFYEEVSANDHINTLESIYNAIEENNIPVVIIGTRPEFNDSNFKTYQEAEIQYFADQENNFNYIDQSSKWPNNKAISDYYNVEDGLLTDRGVNRWVTSITDYLFND